MDAHVIADGQGERDGQGEPADRRAHAEALGALGGETEAAPEGPASVHPVPAPPPPPYWTTTCAR